MQYAYTRIASIFRKANIDINKHRANVIIQEGQEKALVLKTLQFSEAIELVGEEAYPHILCTYLYDLASLFMTFYEACPILKDGVPEEIKLSRLEISKGVAKTLKVGLDLLGISTLEKM